MADTNLWDFPPAIPGDAEQLLGVAAAFARVAGSASWAAGQLTKASGDMAWTGDAADKFRSVLGDLPGQLNQVGQSYGEAGSALSTYAKALYAFQSDFTKLYNRLLDSLSHYQQAQGNNSPNANALNSDLQTVEKQLIAVWQSAADAALTLARKLDDASGKGIVNNASTNWQRYGGDALGVMKWAGGVAVDFAENFANAVVNLVKDLVKLGTDIAHGQWGHIFKDLDDIAHDINTIVGDLAIVLQFVPVVGEIVDAVLLVTAIAMVALDVAQGVEDLAEGESLGEVWDSEGEEFVEDSVNLASAGFGHEGDAVDGEASENALKDVTAQRNEALSQYKEANEAWAKQMNDYLNTGDRATLETAKATHQAAQDAWSKSVKLFKMQTAIKDMPDGLSDFKNAISNKGWYGGIKELRSAQKAGSDTISDLKPTVNVLGRKISYGQASVITSAVSHGLDTGDTVGHAVNTQNETDSGPAVSVGNDIKGAMDL